jgi:hypothetical protein
VNVNGKTSLIVGMVAIATGSNGAIAIPTCSDVEFLDIEVHGEHVVRDYVAGDPALNWPPSGQELGESVRNNGGAAVPGGPGPGFHFPNGVAPGASFCNDSQSPGFHVEG